MTEYEQFKTLTSLKYENCFIDINDSKGKVL